MRSDDVYEQAARDRDEREAQDDLTARDDRTADNDQVTGGDWMGRDERAPGDERMSRDDRLPGDDSMTGDDPLNRDAEFGGARTAGSGRMDRDDDLADGDQLDRDEELGRDRTDRGEHMGRGGELDRDDEFDRERMVSGDQAGRGELGGQLDRDEMTGEDAGLARERGGVDRDRMAGADEELARDERITGPERTGMSGDGRGMPVAGDGADTPLELFGEADVNRFRDEWREIQSKFVDDPQEAVRGADHLVAEVMDSLTETFSHHKHDLEEQWQHGESAETEDLRQALRRYRTFFDQLLNA